MSSKDSHFEMYRGALALFWVDGEFSENEINKFLELVEKSIRLTKEQKDILSSDISTHVALADVWPGITDPQDRAHLINISNMLFWQDGAFCHTEREVIDKLQQDHLATLETDDLKRDLAFMARDARAMWEENEKQLVDRMLPHTRFFYYLEKKITSLLL